MAPRSCKLEQIAEELSRTFRNDHSVRLCNALQARRKVGRLADDATLLRFARSDQITDDDEASGNPDSDLKCGFRSGHDLVDRADQLQPGPNRPFRVVLMRLRIAEIDEHAVAHVFGDEPVVAANHLGDPAMIGADHFAQVLGIEPRREGGRADQVTEHDGELSALG